MKRFALVHSPFVGPSCWAPTAAWLELLGHEAFAVDYGGLIEGDTYEAVAGRIAGRLDGQGWTLVAHSGAGGLVPTILAATDRPAGVLFVDAVLPYPGRSWMDTAPPSLARRLRDLAPDGLLPPWNRWFPADPMPGLITNGQVRADVTAELPFTPLGFLEAKAPLIDVAVPGAYLQLSYAYAAEAGAAAARGWPVSTLNLHHLAMITHAEAVAEAIVSLNPHP